MAGTSTVCFGTQFCMYQASAAEAPVAGVDAFNGTARAVPAKPVLLEHDSGEQVRTHPAPWDRVVRRRRLGELLAVTVGELLAHRLNHLPPARNHLQRHIRGRNNHSCSGRMPPCVTESRLSPKNSARFRTSSVACSLSIELGSVMRAPRVVVVRHAPQGARGLARPSSPGTGAGPCERDPLESRRRARDDGGRLHARELRADALVTGALRARTLRAWALTSLEIVFPPNPRSNQRGQFTIPDDLCNRVSASTIATLSVASTGRTCALIRRIASPGGRRLGSPS